MDLDGFRTMLGERGCDAATIERSIDIAGRYERFVAHRDRTPADSSVADIRAFTRILIEEGENDFGNFLALARFAHHRGAGSVAVEIIGSIDGAEALPNLVERVKQEFGEETAERLLGDVTLPPLGTPVDELPAVTEAVMDRLANGLEPDAVQALLKDCLRDLEDSWYAEAREAYEQSADLDTFLEWRRSAFIETLESCRDSEALFFSQPIDDAVIELVKATPEMNTGRREGNIIHEVKIPHEAAAWIEETDAEARRRLYCHCPWVKLSLNGDAVDVPAEFCACSSGFHKRFWEAVLGEKLTAEVVESVLAGDDRCRFAIRLPDEVVPAG